MERNHKRQDDTADTADTGRGYVYIRVIKIHYKK